MTDQSDSGRTPQDKGERLPYRPARDPLRSPRRLAEERPPLPSSSGAQSDEGYPVRGNRRAADASQSTDPGFVGRGTTAPQQGLQRPLSGEFPAGQYPSANPQGDQRPRRQVPANPAFFPMEQGPMEQGPNDQARAAYRAAPQTPPPNRPVPPSMAPTKNSPQQPSRLPFWAGFALSFLLLTIASLGILLLSTGANRFDLASLQGNDSAWTPPEIMSTPAVDPAQAGAVTASSAGGDYGTGVTLRNVTNTNVRIRQTPGNLSKPEGDVIAGIPAGGRVEVIDGPTSVDGLTWWLVRYTNGNGQVVEGWSAEVTSSGLRILGPDQ